MRAGKEKLSENVTFVPSKVPSVPSYLRRLILIHMVENLYEWSIGTKSPYKLKPYGQIP